MHYSARSRISQQTECWQAVRILVSAGANLETTTDQLFTPLLIAAYNGKLELTKLLIAAGANIEARNKQHYTAVGVAAQQGHVDILGFLLDRYLPSCERVGRNPTALIGAALDRSGSVSVKTSQYVRRLHSSHGEKAQHLGEG